MLNFKWIKKNVSTGDLSVVYTVQFFAWYPLANTNGDIMEGKYL